MIDNSEFSVGSLIGGSIYKGIFHNEQVVVKKIPKAVCADSQLDYLLSFDSENLVKYCGYHGAPNSTDWDLICERCHFSLEDLIKCKAPDLEVKPEEIIRQMVVGLDYLHSKDIIHGSLKPNNVMISNDGTNSVFVKITDYGIRPNIDDKDIFLDVAKAEDVKALGLVSCFVVSRGSGTDINETANDFTAVEESRRPFAMEFIGSLTDPEPFARPDSNVAIFHPFLLLSCHEVRRQFCTFIEFHRDRWKILEQIRDQMEKWKEKLPDGVKCCENEKLDDLEEFIKDMTERVLRYSKFELDSLMNSSCRVAPHLTAYFIWNLVLKFNEKVKVRLIGMISKGGFGVVYKTKWKLKGKCENVAVKCSVNSSSGQEKSLEKEGKILKKLNCPFTVQLLDERQFSSKRYLFLEMCDGTLREFVNDQLTSVPKSAIKETDIVGQLVLGLRYLHGEGIVHNDLKPDNVLLRKLDANCVSVKLADFGLSKQLKGNQSTFSNTQNVGTTGYTAPELISNDQPNKQVKPSFASDAWALGALIFFVLTKGQHPFGSICKLTNDFVFNLSQPPNMKVLKDQPLAAALILRLMNYDPSERPNISLLLSHPYFTCDSDSMRLAVNMKLWQIIRSTPDEIGEVFTPAGVNKWVRSLSARLDQQFSQGNFTNLYMQVMSGTGEDLTNEDLTVCQRNISEKGKKLVNCIQGVGRERGFIDYQELTQHQPLLQLYAWDTVARMNDKRIEEKLQISEWEYAYLRNWPIQIIEQMIKSKAGVKLSSESAIPSGHWTNLKLIDERIEITVQENATAIQRAHQNDKDIIYHLYSNVNEQTPKEASVGMCNRNTNGLSSTEGPMKGGSVFNNHRKVGIDPIFDYRRSNLRATDAHSDASPIGAVPSLVDHGSNGNAITSNGETALDLVAVNTHDVIPSALRDDANLLQPEDPDGATPIHSVAKNNGTEE